MKCQNLFSEEKKKKIRKNISKCHLLKFSSRVLIYKIVLKLINHHWVFVLPDQNKGKKKKKKKEKKKI